MSTIRKLHHGAFRCRDSEATRRFYEDFLGLPLAGAIEFRQQHDFDLHLALEVDAEALRATMARGPSDHDEAMDPRHNGARKTPDRWTATRALVRP